MRVEEEGQARGEAVHVHARVHTPLHVLDPVAQGEGQLLGRRGARLADVVAGDGDGVPPRHVVRAVADHVHDHAHARPRREDVLLLGDELLQDVRLHRPREPLRGYALLLAHADVEGEQHGRGRVDRHGGGDVVEGNALEQRLHVGQGGDGHPALAHLAQRERMVRIAAHEGRQVEGHGEAVRAVLEQVLEARVGLGGGAEARELPHGPDLAAVHGLVDPARVREAAGIGQVALVVEGGHVLRLV